MRWKYLSACAAGVLWSAAAPAGLLNGNRVTVGDQLYGVQNADHDWSLTVSGSPPCALRFEVRSGDRWLGEIQKGAVERSEVHGPVDAADPAQFGRETWTAYQFRIEPGAPSTAGWVVLGDWHVRPDAGDSAVMSSPWQLELRKGDILVFDIRASSEKPVRSNAPEQHIYTSPAPIARGVWHSIVSVADFDWRPQGAGSVTLWLDGAKIADYRGPFGYDTARPPYFKFGIYRATAPETLAVDYANVETSRTSLAARVQAPPPVCAAK